jgi:teichuronic acid biosynthesis glycosyltransferase TuaH
MIQNTDIIVVGLQPWDIAIGSNCRNIALELARHNRVLYVNPPLDRNTFLKHGNTAAVQKRLAVIKGKQDELTVISDSLYILSPAMLAESLNWIPWKSAFRVLNRINNRRLADRILNAVKQLNFNNYILFNDQSMIRCYYLKELLQPVRFIYYMRDNLSAVPYFRKHGLKMERDLITQADVVATNSGYLAGYAGKFNSHAAMVGQGCDFSLYSNTDAIPMADELISIRSAGPVIGYTGYLTSLRLDISLMEEVASKMQQWNFVMVGPEDADFKKSGLHAMRNVHFLGNKDPDDLPQYIKGFDVALNPQLINEITIGNYPRKIDEYLAMGKPVVATSTPFMSYFKAHAYLGTTADEYITLIHQALKEDCAAKSEERRNFALQHTWENNVNAISALLKKFTEYKN